jgi:hypothetical protein
MHTHWQSLWSIICERLGLSISCTPGLVFHWQIRHKINLPRLNEFLAAPSKSIVYHTWKVDTTGDAVEVCWDDLETAKWAGMRW